MLPKTMNESDEKQWENLGKLIILSFGFALLFSVFNTAQNLAS